MYPYLKENGPSATPNTMMTAPKKKDVFAILSHTPEAPEGPSPAANPSCLWWWTVVSHTRQVDF